MWSLKNIKFTNLFSHKSSEYKFLNGKCVIISGENKSDRSLDNNGAGKTTLFEAITIALTNESLRNIKKDDFINNEENECTIDLSLENKVLKSTFRIVRVFNRNKSVKVELWEDGKLNEQITSVNEANKRILELVGVSREDLLRYYIISQDNAYTFFTASDTEKKEVMNRITQASMILPALQSVTDKRLSLMASLGDLEAKVCKYKDKVETLVEQKNYIIENRKSKSDSIRKITEQINSIGGDILKEKEFIKEQNEKLEYLKKQSEEITLIDTTKLSEEKKQYEDRLEETEGLILEDKKIKRNLNAELEETVECPKCGWEFINGSDLGLTVEEAKKLLEETEQHTAKTLDKKERIEARISTISDKIKLAKKNNKNKEELEDQIRHVIQEIELANQRVEQKRKMISVNKEQIKQINEDDSTKQHLQKLEKDIEEYNNLVKQKEEEKKPYEDELDIVNFWIFNLGKSGFMTYLANKSVKTIEGITNSYLRKFGVELSVLINGFKVLKSGEVREKIEVFVSNDGVTAESFMSKSGGERSRVTLAGILGIQHLINNSLGGRGLDFLALDEAISGVDSRGTMEIIKTLNDCGKTVMMITQNIEDSTICENVLHVVKDRGISMYV